MGLEGRYVAPGYLRLLLAVVGKARDASIVTVGTLGIAEVTLFAPTWHSQEVSIKPFQGRGISILFSFGDSLSSLFACASYIAGTPLQYGNKFRR